MRHYAKHKHFAIMVFISFLKRVKEYVSISMGFEGLQYRNGTEGSSVRCNNGGEEAVVGRGSRVVIMGSG